jgi:hypothetical protein
MEELIELKQLIQSGNYSDALLLVEDLEEMGKKGLANNIRSYAKILLLHLIKQQVEKRTTKSWDASIRNAVREIKELNARPKGKGVYLNFEELESAIASSMDTAIDKAALEAAEGIYDYRQIEQMIDRKELVGIAMQLIQAN